jgi:SAM-dependent methyltransferase
MHNNLHLNTIQEQYSRRQGLNGQSLYNPINPDIYLGRQEKERTLIKIINSANLTPVWDKTLLEVGCGSGSNLIELLRLGFLPKNLVGNEILSERCIQAHQLLPNNIKIIEGDAMDILDQQFDIVYQSTVFSSILNQDFQVELANKLWELTKSGGGILWYDFIFNNPKNPDVVGVPVKRIGELFPQGELTVHKVTLAPPLARFVTKLHPNLYHWFNVIPLLRTHVLCWIKKPLDQ